MKLRSRKRRPQRSIEEFLPTCLDDGHHAARAQPCSASEEAAAEVPEQLVRAILAARRKASGPGAR